MNATENNKNIKYTNRNSIKAARKKLNDTNSINSIKAVFTQFITAIKNKHLS
jgi:hypothetical protein